MCQKCDLLEKDFLSLVERIEDDYSFSDLAAPAYIGMVLMFLKSLHEKEGKGHHEPTAENEKTASVKNGLEDVQGLLRAADGHYYDWKLSGDNKYQKMAIESLSKALPVINQAAERFPGDEALAYKKKHDDLLKRLS